MIKSTLLVNGMGHFDLFIFLVFVVNIKDIITGITFFMSFNTVGGVWLVFCPIPCHCLLEPPPMDDGGPPSLGPSVAGVGLHPDLEDAP